MTKPRAVASAAIARGSFALTVLIAAAAAPAVAQTFPDRPVKVVSAYPPGGPSDTMARIATLGLGDALGQNVFVENITGAGGKIGSRAVARAAPDGYTLLLGGTNDNAVTPALYQHLDYDPVKDFAPVAAVARDPQVMVINPAVPVHTLAELVQYAKDASGEIVVGRIDRHRAASAARIFSGAHRNRHRVRAL